ncbi:MAG: carbohydrate ABC transporter permease [Actinobacteria bacterium]|nr:carbohydrate ABC transporter permease [Actinomycetota bacterium]
MPGSSHASILHAGRPGWRRWGRYALLIAVAVVVLFPIYVMVIGALKPGNKVLQDPLLPTSVTFDTIRQAWRDGNLGRALWNSTIVALVVTVAQLVTSVLSAYAFAFLRFPGRTFMFAVFLATLLVPFEATVVVNRETMQDLGWLNSYQGLALPFLATAFGTFLIRQVFVTLPSELLEAARMDGLGHLAVMREVAVPLGRPTLGALALFGFLSTWNQYLWPTLVSTEDDWNTVQSGLRALRQSQLDKPNLIIAGVIIVALPIALILLAFQRQLVRGLTAGAVKG